MSDKPVLLLDADDTLWENNAFFEQAIADFLSLLDHAPHSPAEVRDRLNAIEREHVAVHGYGAGTFERSLVRCYEELSRVGLVEAHRTRIGEFARSIMEAEVELLPGVAEWLPRLAGRYRLVLVTKGDEAEQADKLSRSGLAALFTGVRIVREKDVHVYRGLVTELELIEGETWMVGNSPKSDINPALQAGLNAAYVRYSVPWVLEEEPLRKPAPGRRLLECCSMEEVARELLG